MRRHVVDGYVAAVITAGGAVLAFLVIAAVRTPPTVSLLAVAVLAAALLLGELRPIKISHGDDSVDEVTISSCFSLALVILGPLVLAVGAQVLAVLVDDIRRRKEPRKVAFNAAQYVLTLAAARCVYAAIGGHTIIADTSAFDPGDLLPALAAAVTFFIVNDAITTTVVALSLEVPVMQRIRADLNHHLSTSGVLLALAPVVLESVEFSPWLVPLLLMPIAAVHKSASLAIARERQALHDTLTGLPNRALMRERVQRALHRTGPSGEPLAVMFIDLDHFKEINDTLGHHVGDRLLTAVAGRLAGVVRHEDTVARLGGDEFAILTVGLGRREIEAMAERLTQSLDQPFTLDGVRLDAGASIGIALAPEHGDNVDVLLQRADVALYAAKGDRGTYQVYSADADEHTVERLSLLGDLRRGLEEGRVSLHYQPKCETRNGRLVGVEGLARWEHPERGSISPEIFIPIAENSGLIRPLTRETLRLGLRELRGWSERGHDIGLALNLSTRLLSDLDLPGQVLAALDEAGVPADRLTLEVTESSIMSDSGRARTVLRQLRALGVRLAIDDFGTGYSSLSYLSSLAVDEIKIDKSFVQAMREDNNAAIVRSTIELGHNLGLQVVAEGVEEPEVWRRLLPLGCDFVQGYYIGRPMAAAEFLVWLEAAEARAPLPTGLEPAPEGSRPP